MTSSLPCTTGALGLCYFYVDAAIKPKTPDGLNEHTSCANATVQDVFDTKKVH